MKWHTYGPVEMAINFREPGDPIAWGRLTGETESYAHVHTGLDADGDAVYSWMDPNGGSVPVHVPTILLDAGAVLIWWEWEEFQAAERAMGDPYP
jgi:hypothetical protein